MRNATVWCLRWFVKLWTGLVAVMIVLSHIGTWMKSATVWEFWSKTQEIWNPFNIWNTLALMIAIAPAAGTYWLAEKLSSSSMQSPKKLDRSN